MAQLIVEPNMYLDEIQTLVWVSNLKGSLLKLIEDVGFSYKYLHKVVMSEKNECGEWVEQEGNASTMVTMDIGIRHRRPELPGKRLSGRLRAYHRSIVRKKTRQSFRKLLQRDHAARTGSYTHLSLVTRTP